MQVRCDVCGAALAAVLCCADEAALCSACDRRVHRATKLADKHRRIPLLQPAAADAAAPLCDVCKERRGLVFCVEDRAILCPDCDDAIHTANDLTAKHSRFLLVGAKLSAAALADQPAAPASPDASDDADDAVPAAADVPDNAVPVPIGAQGSCAAKASAATECGGAGAGGSSIGDYLTNICPGWRVDDLLFDDAAFSVAPEAGCGYRVDDGHEQVPSLDADLFDVVAGGRPGKRGGGALGFDKVPAASVVVVPTAAAAKQQQQQQLGYVTERSWNCDSDSDVFAVPEMIPQPPPAKRARPPPPPTFWCF